MRLSTFVALGIASALVILGTVAASSTMDGRASRLPTPALARASNVLGPVTTNGDLAMRNLEGDLLDAKQRASEDPASVAARLQHARLLYMRARVTGDIDEMAGAAAETAEAVRLHPDAADAWIALASQRQTLHRFTDARAALEHARALGAEQERIAGLERELDWNAGKWGEVARSIRDEARRAPTAASVARLARLEHDLAHHDEADALYERALSLIEDTGPIPVAMIELQRGMNLADAGRLEAAAAIFRSAAERLPKYIAAREHLAETLHRLGRDDEAIALYEEITKVSRDPEFLGELGALYRARGRVAEADVLRARATKRYDELLVSYPEAMAWHAAEFFAGEGGDPARARVLLTKNVELRPNPESLEALARLEREAGAIALAEELTRKASEIRAAAREEGAASRMVKTSLQGR